MSRPPNSNGGGADNPRTIVILSRGARLAPMFRATALELARHYRIIVLMYDRTEHEIWKTVPEIVCIDLASEIKAEVARHESDLAERTRAIENEIRLPLYKAASNYLLYRRFAIEYHHSWPPFYESERHMMEEYVGSYGVLSRVLDKYRPILILHEAIDLVTTVVALAAAYQRQIFNWGLILAPAMGDGAMLLYYGLRRSNFVCQYLATNPNLITQGNKARARALIAKARSQGLPTVSHVETRRSALANPLLSARQLLQAGATRSPALLLERARNWLWLGYHLKREIPRQPFILYLMHLQPEASTSSQSPRWVDQERIIEQLAVNAPQGVNIVVKENPQCYGWRGKRYFGSLASFENVHLLHPLVPTQELLRRASALLTITGSAGVEAILMGTRVAVLGRPFYADAPGVRKLDVPEQIFRELADPSWRTPTPADIETFIAAYLQSTHDLGEVVPGKKWPAPEILGPRLAKAVHETLSFVGKQGLRPQQFDPGYPLASVMGAGMNAAMPDQALNEPR